MGFKNAWELVSKKLPLLGINHFFFPFTKYQIPTKGGKNRKKNWGGILLCDEKASIHYYTHLISYSEYFVALKKLSFYFALLSPCHTVLPEK